MWVPAGPHSDGLALPRLGGRSGDEGLCDCICAGCESLTCFPWLPLLCCLCCPSGGRSSETKSRLCKILAFWGDKHVYEQVGRAVGWLEGGVAEQARVRAGGAIAKRPSVESRHSQVRRKAVYHQVGWAPCKGISCKSYGPSAACVLQYAQSPVTLCTVIHPLYLAPL